MSNNVSLCEIFYFFVMLYRKLNKYNSQENYIKYVMCENNGER